MVDTQHDLIREELLSYVIKMHFNEYEGDIDYGTRLLESGIIDSLSMMTFILFLEQQYGLDFLSVDVSRDDFTTISTIAELISRNLAVQKDNDNQPLNAASPGSSVSPRF